MERVIRDVGTNPVITIQSIGGDLRISGREGDELEAQAPEKGELKVEESKKGVEIACRSGCLLFVPKGAQIEAGYIGGDGRMTDIDGEVLIRTVGGDLSLRRLGKTSIERVGGDAQIREIEGDLMIDHVGGDGVIRSVTGITHLRQVGGDLLLGEVSGSIEADVGGDAVVDLRAEANTSTKVHTGGDLSCRLPEEPSVKVQMQAGGDLHVPLGLDIDRSVQNVEITLGEGEAMVDLSAGGDLNLQYGRPIEGFDTDFVGDILTDLDAKLAEMEARFNAMGAGMGSFDADRIGERVRRAVRHAQRRAERATRKAEDMARRAHRKNVNFKFDFDTDLGDLRFADFSHPTPEVSDEERLSILRMVEDGKISVDEAEALLKALEGKS